MTEESNSFLARNFGLSKSKKKNKFLDEETWNKLILALENGAYIEEACAYAGINSATFRRWRQRALEENEEFFVEQWQKIIDAEARFKVNSLIRINELGQTNGNLLLKLLSVKYPLQFGEKSSLQVTNVEEVVVEEVPAVEEAPVEVVPEVTPAVEEVIPEEVYDEICIMLNCDYITFMGIT